MINRESRPGFCFQRHMRSHRGDKYCKVLLSPLLIVPCLSFTFSCSNKDFDAQEQPFIAETISESNNPIIACDLDGDSRDELISVFPEGNFYDIRTGVGHILMLTPDLNTIDQINYSGQVLAPRFLDWDMDGCLEVVVPYHRNDSLFVSFVNGQAKKLFSFFLISGMPRIEDNAVMKWDPDIKGFFLCDVDKDGTQELVTIVRTYYARLPRGILIHSLPEGRLLAKHIVGAAIGMGCFFDDFDGNGEKEVIVNSSATNNGARESGFDDLHAYVISFKLSTPIEIRWMREMGGLGAGSDVFYDDFNADGRKEILTVSGGTSIRPEKTRMEYLNPNTGKTIYQRVFNESITCACVVDLNNDLRPEILGVRSSREIWVFDNRFNVVRTADLRSQVDMLSVLPDVDGDGCDEIVALTPDERLLLNPDLSVKALLPGGGMQQQVFHRGVGNPAHLLLRSDAKTIIVELHKNKLYLVRRYGGVAASVLALGLIVAFMILAESSRHRARIHEVVQKLAIDTDARGLMLLHASGEVLMTNSTWRQWMGTNGGRTRRTQHYREVTTPQLIDFIRQATTLPARRHDAILTLRREKQERAVKVAADPVTVPGDKKLYWLVSINDQSIDLELHRAKTWSNMAQRVAHDLKNPLTSILLTLQRLQKEYRARSPEAAPVYETYVTKLSERIETLRRMTRNFMKFVDVEELNLTETNLNNFLQRLCAAIHDNLPPDITVELKPGADATAIKMDEEQMQAVLENLVANAVNAMPNGGKITIATHLARNLQRHSGHEKPGDYVVLEVQDTGIGIPQTNIERLFDPDFTATEGGTGLGLAIAKKIVDGHGGHIEVESEQGVGTVLEVYLPIQ